MCEKYLKIQKLYFLVYLRYNQYKKNVYLGDTLDKIINLINYKIIFIQDVNLKIIYKNS